MLKRASRAPDPDTFFAGRFNGLWASIQEIEELPVYLDAYIAQPDPAPICIAHTEYMSIFVQPVRHARDFYPRDRSPADGPMFEWELLGQL